MLVCECERTSAHTLNDACLSACNCACNIVVGDHFGVGVWVFMSERKSIYTQRCVYIYTCVYNVEAGDLRVFTCV